MDSDQKWHGSAGKLLNGSTTLLRKKCYYTPIYGYTQKIAYMGQWVSMSTIRPVKCEKC